MQALSSAEAAYTRAMNAVSRVKLVGECDGPTLRAALARFSDIPWLIGEVGLPSGFAIACINHASFGEHQSRLSLVT